MWYKKWKIDFIDFIMTDIDWIFVAKKQMLERLTAAKFLSLKSIMGE